MKQHLPPFLMVSEPGSFAEFTIRERKPQIISDVIARNSYPTEIVDALTVFRHEIASLPVAPLREVAPDAGLWLRAWEPWRGRSWFELPWYLAETYFYRRLLETVRYFRPGPWQSMDPFAAQKTRALTEGLPMLGAFLATLPTEMEDEALVRNWLYRSLWGNRADLSNLASSALSAHEDEGSLLVVDHTQRLASLLVSGNVRRLDLVADNAGLELLVDLGLLDLLLARRLVRQVHVHLKGQPFFVSDAMPHDAESAIVALRAAEDPLLAALGERLDDHRAQARLLLSTDPFWTTCQFYSEMPPMLRRRLGRAQIILFKGDVNYRRLLEDRHWPHTTPLEEITRYMPAPYAVLRTLKGELLVGLMEGQAEALAGEEPDWLINGRRGLIQLVGG